MSLTKTKDTKEESVILRKLAHYDQEEYLSLLRQLTAVGSYGSARWSVVFEEIQDSGNTEIFVLYDESHPGTLLGAGTLLMEWKFIHGGSQVGHIEDIVVSQKARGRGLGRRIVNFLSNRAKEKGAYKVILDCKEELKGFYEGSGFKKAEIQMRKDLNTY